MDCHHFDAGRCRSCSWLPRRYDAQLAALQDHCVATLGDQPDLDWLPPYAGPETGFRNKAKMVVSGTVAEPVLGILGDGAVGVDLRDCGLHVPAIVAALPVLAAFITRADLTPYDVASRRGELKFVLVTAAPTGSLMVRFVARSQEPVSRLRKHLSWLREQLPGLVVASVNVQPEHKAVLEGDQEILLTDTATLTMPVNGHELQLRPQSFFQTNTVVAAALYAEAAEWIQECAPDTVWDLFCGVGGFALHAEGTGRRVLGVESSPEAVLSAEQTAASTGSRARFVAADATSYIQGRPAPDLVVVNPPRRGIGAELAAWLDAATSRHVVYSSCNPESLAKDLAAMPSLRARRARVFDMFPHTTHAEVLVLLERSGPPDAVRSTRH